MIVLDTNVVSELMRAEPAPTVLTWIRQRSADDLYTTAVTVRRCRHRA
jgi:predicted nucleic acid-binding protein